MRHPCASRFVRVVIALVFGLAGGAAGALEIEDHRLYPGTGDTVVRVISTGDLAVFEPFLRAFQQEEPQIGIDYTVVSSADLHAAVRDGASFDLAISSAMDLQFQIANDGGAQSYRSAATEALPAWARWRDQVFAFSAEPAVAVISRTRFDGLPRPRTRQELIALLRERPEVFADSVGTYDARISGLGYLFATQEARNSDIYWRLSELMGRLGARLYCCSAQMIDDVASGTLAIAYNVLGSYTAERIARDDRVEILALEDYATVMLRTALIPATATETEGAALLLDRLLQEGLRQTGASWALPPLGAPDDPAATAYGPIRLGPALLVYLDPLNRESFLGAWVDAMVQ